MIKLDTPSFALGFTCCLLLSYASPWLAVIVGGILNFIKFTIIMGIVLGAAYVVGMNSNKRNVKLAEKSAEKVNDRASDIGTFKYFDIPVTKLDERKHEKLATFSESLRYENFVNMAK
ncbi:hypothetical protein KAFR_0J01930 [Kazachstania africana CBS 2517]|uniref:Uncharacterized protein n=1 Tax=Kazachstania africana (strain ATCC 22294 / BCRC 22015 / CBS 2517 / CECT 1963 / NBRC 1671 / NRRL Y-8276) TaxID=1071382 RepID=H2B0V7_KAZAF|nr:hypothetical protein KAFR_0J01930 [Kazachstania africana CBS 2517]CCF60257.1 hypothetical protein KAFR_0J01930 [Kazachstania africana CBS 2517]